MSNQSLGSWCIHCTEGRGRTHEPVVEARDAVFKLSLGLEFGIGNGHNIDLRQGMADESLEMLREAAEGIIAALQGCVSGNMSG